MRKFLLLSVLTLLALAWGGAQSFGASSAALSRIIEGAKQEGQVAVTLDSKLAGKGIERLKKSIAERYGVNLQIDYAPVGSYPERLAKAITELKAGAAPSFDLMVFSDGIMSRAVSAGVGEKMDWKPLLDEGTPPEVIQFDGYALSTHTGHIGLIYNPAVIPPQDAPKSLKDLANPKWKGKLLVYSYTSSLLDYAFVLGVDKTLATLREIMKNNPVVDIYARNFTRFMAGEYPIVLISSEFLPDTQRKGVPARWVSPDISYIRIHSVMVTKGARNPNAAKLVAVYLSGPEGRKFMFEEAGAGSAFYPGNFENDIDQEDRKLGLQVFNLLKSPGALDFATSEKGKQVDREIGKILQGR